MVGQPENLPSQRQRLRVHDEVQHLHQAQHPRASQVGARIRTWKTRRVNGGCCQPPFVLGCLLLATALALGEQRNLSDHIPGEFPGNSPVYQALNRAIPL